MSEDEIGVKINLDSSGFTGAIKGMIDKVKDFKEMNSQELAEVITKFGEVGLAVAALAAAMYATKKAFEWEEEAEAIKKIEKQFEILSENAGVSGEAVLQGMRKASNGVVDNTTLMKLANEQFVRLGALSGQLPEIMELATKATQVMGGTVEENFTKISMAVATGNQKLLKHLGLKINLKKAEEDYAKSLGYTVDMLTESGKQQARLNAVLASGSTKFKGITQDTGTVTISFQKVNVAIKEIWDTFLMVFDKLFGPVLKKAAQEIADFFSVLNLNLKSVFGEGARKAEADLILVDRRLTELQKKVKDEEAYKAKFGVFLNPGDYAAAKQQIAALQKQKDELEKASPKLAGSGERSETERKEDDIDQEKVLAKKRENQAKFEADVLKMNDERIKAEEKSASNMTEFDKNQTEQRKSFQMAYAAELQGIRNSSDMSQKQKIQQMEQVAQTHTAKMKSMEDDLSTKRTAALEKWGVDNRSTMKQISDAMAAQSAAAHKSMVDTQRIGTQAFSAIGSNAKNAFLAIGEGSQTAGEAMKGFMLGALADIAESNGEVMLLEGIWPPNPAALAGGAALLVLAGALRSQAGTGGALKGGASAGGGGGGYYSASASAASASAPSGVTPQEKKTVTVQIMGHVFDSQESGTRIAEIIKQNADATDFNYKPIGTA